MEYKRGKKYRITIEGWVTGQATVGQVSLATDPENSRTTYIHPDFIVSSEEIVPPLPDNWPPQPGDLWADDDGMHWFCRRAADSSLCLVSQESQRVIAGPAEVPVLAPGLHLVLRKTSDGRHMSMYFDQQVHRVPVARTGKA